MNYDIKDKTILVTGANRGIGKALVESFIERGKTSEDTVGESNQ